MGGPPLETEKGRPSTRPRSNEDVEQLGRFVSGLDEVLGDARLATVVPDTVAFGLGRMSQARIETRVRIQFFYNRAEAESWIHE